MSIVNIEIVLKNIKKPEERTKAFILCLKKPLYYQESDGEQASERLIDQIILVRYEDCDRDWEIKGFLELMAKMSCERKRIIVEGYKKEKKAGFPVDGYSIEIQKEWKNDQGQLCHDLVFYPESCWEIKFPQNNSTRGRKVIISLIILVVVFLIGWWIKSVKSSRSAKGEK